MWRHGWYKGSFWGGSRIRNIKGKKNKSCKMWRQKRYMGQENGKIVQLGARKCKTCNMR